MNERLMYNEINDNILVVVQIDGVETIRYRYIPILKATMEYKHINSEDKKINKNLTFRIRRNEFVGAKEKDAINYIDANGISLNFYNIQAAQNYINEKYGPNKLTDWSVSVG